MTPDTTNEMFELAAQLVNQSSRSIFLTGKAGTGKTTFLKYIRENCPKQMAVVAPTGVAAINAGGVTIHSFFQLPFAPFIPASTAFGGNGEEIVSRHNLTSRLKINGDKIKVIRQLELLVIDEISMVRADTMDAIDVVLRHIRRRPYERFGGVQLLLIGDMFQLPPVIKEQEWKILSEYYASPYFFDSAIIKEEPPLYIEFTKIYRQSEEKFIRVLNQVRNNAIDEESLVILESRYQPSFRRNNKDEYIVLTTHNETARTINSSELSKLDGRSFTYKAVIEGDFPPMAFPADEALQLKEGAQVMFIKNDSDRGKRYFNGKIGIVTALEADKIVVKCKDDTDEIEVGKELWENIRYAVDKSSRDMKEQVIGSFAQYPLRLAWAITIHKSQGLTFEKAIIDAGEAFAPGQVYVALSRCTSLDGMVLQSRLRNGSVYTDQRIVAFSRKIASSHTVKEELEIAKKMYREKLLLETFDFAAAVNSINELRDLVAEHGAAFNSDALTWIGELLKKAGAVQDTALKFHIWLKAQFQQTGVSEENLVLQERVSKAALHFTKELESIIEFLQQPKLATDSKLNAKSVNEGLKEVFAELAVKKHLVQAFEDKIDPDAWYQRKKGFIVPAFPVNVYGGSAGTKSDIPNPALYQQLKRLRDSICDRQGLPIYLVASSSTLEELALYLPQSLEELRGINGFGDTKVRRYGQEFLDIIIGYSEANGLGSNMANKSLKRERIDTGTEKKSKKDTKAETYKMFSEGKTINDIARERNLTIQTIEGHLAHYVSQGIIDIERLVSREKLSLIEPVLETHEGNAMLPVKEKLGNEVSYGEIRLAMAWKEFQDSSK